MNEIIIRTKWADGRITTVAFAGSVYKLQPEEWQKLIKLVVKTQESQIHPIQPPVETSAGVIIGISELRGFFFIQH